MDKEIIDVIIKNLILNMLIYVMFFKNSGGTGIGFMTTFETMKETKASLIIDEMREMSNTDYTKSVTIRFDGKNEYRIKSYRNDEIKKKMKDNRIIIEN